MGDMSTSSDGHCDCRVNRISSYNNSTTTTAAAASNPQDDTGYVVPALKRELRRIADPGAQQAGIKKLKEVLAKARKS